MGGQPAADRPSRFRRKPLEEGGKVEPHRSRRVALGEDTELFQKSRRGRAAFARELDRPGPNEVVRARERFKRERLGETARSMKRPKCAQFSSLVGILPKELGQGFVDAGIGSALLEEP